MPDCPDECTAFLLALSKDPAHCFPEVAESAVAGLDRIGIQDAKLEAFDWEAEERRRPLGRRNAEFSRSPPIMGEKEEKLRLGLGGEVGGRALFAEAEKKIVDDANALGQGRLARRGFAHAPNDSRREADIGAAVACKLKGQPRPRQVALRRGTVDGDEKCLPPALVGRRPAKRLAKVNFASVVLAP